MITKHSATRIAERGISINEISNAIASGEIIRQYEDDHPFPSSLILGSSGEKILHIVASIDEDMIYLITAYVPDPLKWNEDYRTRRAD